jgi:hypothetical protein
MQSLSATSAASTSAVKPRNLPRLLTLFIAFIGCTVTSLPFLYAMTTPVPLILIGFGVTVVALALFLFFSL